MNPLWTTSIGAAPRGLSLAREVGHILVWDHRSLHLFERGRQSLASQTMPAPLVSACLADDGSALAAIGVKGEIWFFDGKIKLVWEKQLPQAGLAVALDSFGRFIAACDASGNLRLFDRKGTLLAETKTPRPLRYLAFIPERPALVGAADFGLVAVYDARLQCLWRDGLVANVGSLAVSGTGETIALAGFSAGLYCYRMTGPPHTWLPLSSPCKLAALRYDGRRVLFVNQANHLQLVDLEQKVQGEFVLPGTPVEIAISPLGDFAVAALANATLMAFQTA